MAQEPTASILLEYHSSTQRAAVSLVTPSFSAPSQKIHGSCMPLAPSQDSDAPTNVYLTKLDWPESLHITDICVTSKPFKEVRDGSHSHHFVSNDVGRSDLLDFMASFMENGWTIKASCSEDKFWFEKFVPGFKVSETKCIVGRIVGRKNIYNILNKMLTLTLNASS